MLSIIDLHFPPDHAALCPRSHPGCNRFGGRLLSCEEPHKEKLDDICVNEQKLCSSVTLSTALRV